MNANETLELIRTTTLTAFGDPPCDTCGRWHPNNIEDQHHPIAWRYNKGQCSLARMAKETKALEGCVLHTKEKDNK